MYKTTSCPVCGKLFVSESNRRIYCSKTCRDESYRKTVSSDKKNSGKKGRKKKVRSLSEIATEARNAGMSYGKYVAMMERGDLS